MQVTRQNQKGVAVQKVRPKLSAEHGHAMNHGDWLASIRSHVLAIVRPPPALAFSCAYTRVCIRVYIQ